MNCILIGYGEIGKAVNEYYSKYHQINYCDIKIDNFSYLSKYDIMLVTIPYQDDFVDIINGYKNRFNVDNIVIFSTVPIGTTRKIKGAVHSPIEGQHPNLYKSLKEWVVFVGGENEMVFNFFYEADKDIKKIEDSRHTEFMKLQSTTNYGMQIAYAKYVGDVCDDIGLDYRNIISYNAFYTDLYGALGKPWICRQIVTPPEDEGLKGHCVLENAIILNEQYPSKQLKEILKLGKNKETINGKPYLNKTWLYIETKIKNRSLIDIAEEYDVDYDDLIGGDSL